MSLYQGKDRSTWEAEINALIFDDIQDIIMTRLYPNSQFEYGEITSETEEQLYDLISPYQLVGETRIYDTKLVWADVLAGVSDYINEKLNEIDIRFRVYDLYNWAQATIDAATLDSFSNQELLIDHIIENDLEADLVLIEAADAPLRTEGVFLLGVEATKMRIDLGKDIIATINYMNAVNSITALQSSTILADAEIKQILEALQVGALETAQAIMSAKDLTGLEPMDQSYKDRIDLIINNFLGV